MATEKTTPVPEPQAGGSYRRNADGSLTRVAGTAEPSMADRMAAKRQALGLGVESAGDAPQPTPEA